MRVLHISTYAGASGAGRAAYNLHKALQGQDIDSRMLVAKSSVQEPEIIELAGASQMRWRLAQRADRALWSLQHSSNTTWRSPAYFGVDLRKEIDRINPDVINLHWVTNGFMTIEGIGRVNRPTVWSLYDMWPFSGSEHYGSSPTRVREGYWASNRPQGDSRVDIDRWCWNRKARAWPSTMAIVAASRWSESNARTSALMSPWPISLIPHAVDDRVFTLGETKGARERWGLAPDVPTIAFIASAGLGDHRKGGDIFLAAVQRMQNSGTQFQVLIVGPQTAEVPQGLNNITWVAGVSDDNELQSLYSAASVVVVPSREDTLPLVALEAQMCGVPIVASDVGGLAEAVEPGVSGALVPAEDSTALADALTRVISEGVSDTAERIRERAVALWSFGAVATQYAQTYARAPLQ